MSVDRIEAVRSPIMPAVPLAAPSSRSWILMRPRCFASWPTDRHPSGRSTARHKVPAALRAEVESLLRFAGETAASFHDHVAAAAHEVLLEAPGAESPPHTVLLQGTKLTTGTRLGQYEIDTQLGAGGMGIVFRARDIRLDRAVALKILPDRWARDSDRLARFEREARILASLNHPNVATLFEIFEAGERRVLVMELVEGPTLAERIGSERISVREALSVFLEVADGLEAAHERGVVHRDLKPANIKAPDRRSNEDTGFRHREDLREGE